MAGFGLDGVAAHRSPLFGAWVRAGGGVRFRLWAPACRCVELLLDGAIGLPMHPVQVAGSSGWFSRVVPDARPGTRYRFILDGNAVIPDPASRCNPDGVDGDSEVVDARAWGRVAPRWRDAGPEASRQARRGIRLRPGSAKPWHGRPWHEAVLCEVHIGTFTPEGTFVAAAARLPELARAGFTAVQLMPVAAFAGRHGWGYDGVLPMAPHAAYGRPEDLLHFVGEAHRLGLMVLGDLVLNHLGPQGNPWPACAAGYFDRGDRGRDTPWGGAPDFDGPHAWPVRRFFVESALHWVEVFGFDGLRLDAVHAVHDHSSPDIMQTVVGALREAGQRLGRQVHAVLENDANEAWRLAATLTTPSAAQAGSDRADAQWNDDFQHAAQVILTGERHRHLGDVADHPHWFLARALAQGFGFQGERSRWRGGAARGQPSIDLPPTAFVNFNQTHDVIGNRADGRRLIDLADPAALRAMTAILLLAPSIPLLFMGQEWGARTPFHYFCDFEAPLSAEVAAGRRREFAEDPGFAEASLPDPSSRAAFERSRLGRSDGAGANEPAAPERVNATGQRPTAWAMLTRRLLRLRQRRLVPWLSGARSGMFHVLAPGQLHVQWPLDGGTSAAGAVVLHLLANLDADPAPAECLPPGEVLWCEPRLAATAPAVGVISVQLPPWLVRFSIDGLAAEAAGGRG